MWNTSYLYSYAIRYLQAFVQIRKCPLSYLVFLHPSWWQRDQEEQLSQAPGQKELLKNFASYKESTANLLVIVVHRRERNDTNLGKFPP